MKDFENYLSELSTIKKIEVPDLIFEKIQSKINEKKQPDKTIWLYGIAASILLLLSFSFAANDAFNNRNKAENPITMDSSSVNFINY